MNDLQDLKNPFTKNSYYRVEAAREKGQSEDQFADNVTHICTK